MTSRTLLTSRDGSAVHFLLWPLLVSALPTQQRRWTAWRRAVSALDISAPFPHFFLFFDLWRKNNEAGNFLNAVEREPVETRVLNPTASEASYKPKQRSYRKTKLKKLANSPAPSLAPNSLAVQMPGAQIFSDQTVAPKRTRRVYPLLGAEPKSCALFWNE